MHSYYRQANQTSAQNICLLTVHSILGSNYNKQYQKTGEGISLLLLISHLSKRVLLRVLLILFLYTYMYMYVVFIQL